MNTPTTLNVDELTPGRETDALIAERILGWRKRPGPAYDHLGPTPVNLVLIPPTISDEDLERGAYWPRAGEVKPWYACLPWSTSIVYAWELVEHFQRQLLALVVQPYLPYYAGEVATGYRVSIRPSHNVELNYATHDKAPMAICKAALLALKFGYGP